MKNKKKLLIAVAAMGLVAIATAGIGTAAWYSTSANATRSVVDNTYTIETTSTGANIANVQFACTAGNASGLYLTNYSDSKVWTGYVSNSTPYVQEVASPAADTHYKAITVTVTATLTTGDGDLAAALSSLNAQGYTVKAKVEAQGYARAAFVTTSAVLFAGTSKADGNDSNNVSVGNGTASGNTAITGASNVAAITAFTLAQTYTVYVSVAPKNTDATADIPGDHTLDKVNVSVSVEK